MYCFYVNKMIHYERVLRYHFLIIKILKTSNSLKTTDNAIKAHLICYLTSF